MNFGKLAAAIFVLLASAQSAFGDCDGKVTEVLSGSGYCSGGDRVGFVWTGGSNWLCSANKNMDALIIAAYTFEKTISVRDSTWTSCFNNPAGTTPNHIWFQE